MKRKLFKLSDFRRTDPTSEEIKRNGVGPLKRNAAQCLLCNDIIESENRHDFKWCSCKSLAVDGGSWYAKRVFNHKSDFIDIIEKW